MGILRVAGAVRLFGCKTLWLAAGLHPAGRALVNALGSNDPNLRTIAGMFLVQGGRKAAPLLEEALARREHLAMVLTIIGDIGDPRFEDDLRRFSHDANPEVAAAAKSAAEVLEATERAGKRQ